MTASTIKTATVLAFERKLSNSDALMYAGTWTERKRGELWESIQVQEKDLRGTISNRQKNAVASDPAKLDAEVQKPNLQRVDVAALPFARDTLKLSFSLRVLGGVAMPCACNDQEYQEALVAKIKGYQERYQFLELASRYAESIASGRFLWRNRIGTEAIEIRVTRIEDNLAKEEWVFNGHSFNLRYFPNHLNEVSELANFISNGLNTDGFTYLKIDAFSKLGAGQEVYPSQELVLDASDSNRKSKVLYQVNGIAAMHSQKIGNALRTIDTWYPGAEKLGPIAVEPFGSVTSRGVAYRTPSDKMDFYTLLDNWIIKNIEPEIEQQHYVIACLIRGGVFGAKGE